MLPLLLSFRIISSIILRICFFHFWAVFLAMIKAFVCFFCITAFSFSMILFFLQTNTDFNCDLVSSSQSVYSLYSELSFDLSLSSVFPCIKSSSVFFLDNTRCFRVSHHFSIFESDSFSSSNESDSSPLSRSLWFNVDKLGVVNMSVSLRTYLG